MFEILHLYGIPKAIVDAIKSLYVNTTASIITSDGETKTFEVKAGVLQGDTLAPFSFIIVLNYVLRISIDKIPDKASSKQPSSFCLPN